MPAELSKEQREILQRTAPVDEPADFQALLADAKPRMDVVVKEVQEPDQPVSTTLTELRDLAIAVNLYKGELEKKGYDAAKRTGLLDAIRMTATAQVWFGDGFKGGAFRARPVAEVIGASRPWRARLKAMGDQAFVFDPQIAEQFADVNSTGTLEEEVSDLDMLNKLIDQHRPALDAVGMTEQFAQQGKTLYEEANGRDLSAILGVRNRAEATLLRNRILTFATLLGREARASGINACFDDDVARRRFEATSFRAALRSIRARRGRGKGEGGEETPPVAEPKAPPGKPADPGAGKPE